MGYEHLHPVLAKLCDKYTQLRFSEWAELYSSGITLNDYSENSDDPEDEINVDLFWQAHTTVLEIEKNNNGRYAHIAISVYPWGVNSAPPAPAAGMLVYENGVCDVGLPWEEYLYDQNTGERVLGA